VIQTIGYEGATLADFLATLKEARVETLVDVRDLPLSRRAGFSKRPLSEALGEVGIEYQHWKALGTPPEIRNAYKATRDHTTFRKDYLAFLDWHTADLERLFALAGEKRICLLCFEASHDECHRSLITERMGELGLLDSVTHLRVTRDAGADSP
jgi:uncharacterized protein (DUF488 family)